MLGWVASKESFLMEATEKDFKSILHKNKIKIKAIATNKITLYTKEVAKKAKEILSDLFQVKILDDGITLELMKKKKVNEETTSADIGSDVAVAKCNGNGIDCCDCCKKKRIKNIFRRIESIREKRSRK